LLALSPANREDQTMPKIRQLANQLSAIVAELERADELICAAHLQFVIDKLEMPNRQSMP
jgi:hypothetical protein